MMTLCVRYAKDRDHATEIVNDGFLKVFRNLNRYDAAKGSLYTWIKRIIINTSIDFLRQGQGAPAIEMLPAEEEGAAVENEALGKMSGEEILQIIRQLPANARAVFNLYAIDGFSHREIAEIMQINEGTSRWHLSEARRQLKTIIHLMESN